ncbi:MAG: SagB/ThcOx family dehydrogenase [Candidatus Hodarchaeales archaeon]|jgi:SagB-type dehydrogenase family enzyme
MKEQRKMLKMWDADKYAEEFPKSDQTKKLPQPAIQKDYPQDAASINLVLPEKITIGNIPFRDVVAKRMSHRKFTAEPLTLEELSFLLWCTQGVKRVSRKGTLIRRTVPSAGARHTFETYLVINRVEGLEPGLYRYLSVSHQLYFVKAVENAEELIAKLSYDQSFIGKAAVIFYWVTVPYRMEWRYAVLSGKFIALDAGHVCQNLYLACEAINAGTCAIGYYDQSKVDAFLGIDGQDEFTIYVAPVGKVPKKVTLGRFLQAPKAKVDPSAFQKFEGKYQSQTGVHEVKLIDNQLFILVGGQYEEPLEPYNEMEVLGDEPTIAARFVLDDQNKPMKMVVLTDQGEVVELDWVPEK